MIAHETHGREGIGFDYHNGLVLFFFLSWKKDKASILIRARDYVNTLKSRLSELEERNRTLEELMQHQCDDGGDRDDVSDEQIDIEVDINRAAAAEETSQEFHLKIVVRSGYDAMDAVLGILECLKELGDIRLATMDTGSRATTLALQMKVSIYSSCMIYQ